eukprot:5533936-Prymnesium_polylepis.2
MASQRCCRTPRRTVLCPYVACALACSITPCLPPQSSPIPRPAHRQYAIGAWHLVRLPVVR